MIKIVLFGPESTGKTTLARALSEHFQCPWVPEYMREYLEVKWKVEGELISKEDLIPIAEGQLRLEREVEKTAPSLVFFDTNLLELKVYSQYYYDGYTPSFINDQLGKLNYHLYLLTDVDTPWVPDILRDRPHNREEMFRIFEDELKTQKLPYHVLHGTHETRMKRAVEIVDSLMPKSPNQL